MRTSLSGLETFLGRFSALHLSHAVQIMGKLRNRPRLALVSRGKTTKQHRATVETRQHEEARFHRFALISKPPPRTLQHYTTGVIDQQTTTVFPKFRKSRPRLPTLDFSFRQSSSAGRVSPARATPCSSKFLTQIVSSELN